MEFQKNYRSRIAIPTLLIGLAIAYNYINSFAYITVSSSVDGTISLYEAGFMDGSSYKEVLHLSQ